DGTRPGYIRMSTDDETVVIEIASRRSGGAGPIFVRYAFENPVDFRLSAQFKYPEFTQGAVKDDAAGSNAFSTLWRNVNPTLETTQGPRLVLATRPAGTTLSMDKAGFVKEIKSTREVILCLDATEPAFEPAVGQDYVSSWIARLGGYRDGEA